MTVEAFWEGVRVANMVLSLIAFGLMVMTAIAHWDEMPTRMRRIIPWVAATYGIIAYGTLEVLRSDVYVAPGMRVGLLAINLVGLLIAMLYRMNDKYTYADGPGFHSDEERRKK